MLTLYDFHGLRILPGRETAEPTWPRAALWLMGSQPNNNRPEGGETGVGLRMGNKLTTPFLYPSPEMQRHPEVTPCNDTLELPIPHGPVGFSSSSHGAQVHPPRCGLWGGTSPAPTSPSSGSVEEALREASVQTLVRNTRAGNQLATPSPLFLGR